VYADAGFVRLGHSLFPIRQLGVHHKKPNVDNACADCRETPNQLAAFALALLDEERV
jgi:hypothetical protein